MEKGEISEALRVSKGKEECIRHNSIFKGKYLDCMKRKTY